MISVNDRRILIVIHSLRGGGAGRMCVFLANGLSRRGWAVTVAVNLTVDAKWRERLDHDVHQVDLARGHARRVLIPLTRLVREVRPSVVLAFNYQVAILLPLVRRLSGTPFRAVGRTVVALSAAARFKSFWQREIVMPVVRRRYRYLDAVIAQSAGMLPDLEQNFGVPRSKIHVIHNPAVPPPLPDPPRPPDPSEDSRRNTSRRTLLYLGRFKPQKQPFLLLDVLASITDRTGWDESALVPPAITLIAAGEGPLVDRFLAEAQERGLDAMVDYRGYVEDVDPLFAEADVTLLTSAYEGFPNVLVESIVRGVPVVTFDCPTGPSEIVEAGVNGFIVPLNDIDAYVTSLRRLLDDPPDTKSVRATATRFLPENVLDQYEAVFYG